MKTKKCENLGAVRGQRHGGYRRSPVQACCNLATKVGELRDRVVEKLRADVRDSISENRMRLAIIEAEALAWTTPYPLLFLPTLAEEKVLGARDWASHQQEILQRQKALAAIL